MAKPMEIIMTDSTHAKAKTPHVAHGVILTKSERDARWGTGPHPSDGLSDEEVRRQVELMREERREASQAAAAFFLRFFSSKSVQDKED